MALPQTTPTLLRRLTAIRRAARRSLVLVLLGAAVAAHAGTGTAVRGVDVEGTGNNRLIRIRTTSKPTFTVFRLASPMRVVVDISGGDLSAMEGPVVVEDGVVGQIAMRQFSADGFKIARIIVGFETDITYEVNAEGNAVVIRTGDNPRAAVDRAVPPPVAPVDRAATERLEQARQQAEAAASRAMRERQRADEAARHAQNQKEESQRIATEAERLRSEAQRAKEEAAELRRQAEKSIARDRAAAEKLATQAESRLRVLEAEQQAVARDRAAAERLAAQAERTRRDAEETAAGAEARHKQHVAELEEQSARAQNEKRAAEAAWTRARLAKREAEAARQAADKARAAAEHTREATTAELVDIAAREKKLEASRVDLEKSRRLTAAERREVEEKLRELRQKRRALAVERRELDAERQQAETRRQAVEAEERRLEQKRKELEKKREVLAAERTRVATMQRRVDAAQESLERDRAELAAAQSAFESSATAGSAARKRRLQAERAKLERMRSSIADSQRELREERRRLARARKKLEDAESDQKALARERRTLEQERAAVAKQRRELEVLEARLQRQKKARRARRASAASRGEVTLASARSNATPRRRHTLRRVEHRGSGSGAGLLLVLDGAPAYQAQRIDNPPRLVLDLADTARGPDRYSYSVRSPFIRQVRLGDHGSTLRVVLDLTAAASKHDILKTAEGLLVRMQPPPTPKIPAVASTTPRPTTGVANLRDVRFKGDGEVARVILEVADSVAAKVDDRSKRAWVLELAGAMVPKSLEQSLDTTAYGSVVRLVSTYQASAEPPVVNVVANLNGRATSSLKRDNGSLVWEIRGRPAPPPRVAAASTSQTAGFAAEAQVLARSTPKQTRKKRISIDLKDADIVNVLRLLAEISGENIIASDDVRGQVTLKLRNVPWDQALDTILRTKGYDKVRHHNILRIAPADKIRQEKEQELAKKKAQQQVEDTVIRMVTVNYAEADDIATQVKPLLTGRGSVQTDIRTNTIIIEDVKSNIRRLVDLAQRLDKQTPQVLIEARIVEASTNNLDQFGIQWGGTIQADASTGNPTGLSFPNSVGLSGFGQAPKNFAVNIPLGVANGGGFDLTLGSANGAATLNLTLAALEEEGKGRIISSPRITTLDNRTAKISQGVDIPVTVVSASGANTRFVPATLELEVTPHVTNDGSVLMKIKTAKNEPDFANVGFDNTPSILKKMAETEVLVRDGDTTVIGGIYTRNVSETYTKVPILADIPILGWLFKSKRLSDDRAELLVFITPRIINRQESLVEGVSLPGSEESR
jgi:type IV pilus assembly protein PilQ